MKKHIPSLCGICLGLSFCVACLVVVSPPSRAQTAYGAVTGPSRMLREPQSPMPQVTLTNLGTSEKRTQSMEMMGFTPS